MIESNQYTIKKMTVNQLSVFIENKSGRLNEILDVIGCSNIRILAATLADTSEYGILRLITSDNEKAYNQLKENRISVNRSEVLVLSSSGEAGDFSRQLNYFATAKISVEYMYCFSYAKKAFMIVRLNNYDLAKEVVVKNNLKIISESELAEL